MKRISIPLILLPLTVILTGCFDVDEDFTTIRNITLKEYGRHFSVEHEFSIGSFGLWIAGGIAGIAAPDDIAAEVVKSVSGVQVGIYKRHDEQDMPTRNLLIKIDRQMNKRGWQYLVKTFHNNEMSAVYINKNSKKLLNELFIVNIENHEIDIVHVSGDLEKIIELAIKDQGISFNYN